LCRALRPRNGKCFVLTTKAKEEPPRWREATSNNSRKKWSEGRMTGLVKARRRKTSNKGNNDDHNSEAGESITQSKQTTIKRKKKRITLWWEAAAHQHF
jgi:hypothetical protein